MKKIAFAFIAALAVMSFAGCKKKDPAKEAMAKIEGFKTAMCACKAGDKACAEKVGKDMPPYCILGACNPQFASRAIEMEPQIGTLLPCNVVVRVEGGKTIVEIMDPDAVMALVDKPGVATVAQEVRERLSRVLAQL